jgi:hypothetical protein
MRFRGLTLPRGFHFVTTGLDPVVHAPVVHAEVQLSMDCRIKSGNDEHKIVLAARLRPSPAHDDASKRFAVLRKGRGKRSAERRIQPMSAHRRKVYAACANRLRAEAARCRGPLAFRRSTAALAKATERFGSPGRASREREDAGVARAVDHA